MSYASNSLFRYMLAAKPPYWLQGVAHDANVDTTLLEPCFDSFFAIPIAFLHDFCDVVATRTVVPPPRPLRFVDPLADQDPLNQV